MKFVIYYMKRLMLLCLLIPIFAFGQPGEYYYAQSTGNLNFVLYTVKQQEPYKNIASLFGLSVQEITYLNGGNMHSIANVGDQIIIPLTSKNFYRWKDIPADISAQPVYVQLKRETDLQEIVNKYRLRADFFKRWNDTQESRFDAGAELIVGYIAYNSIDNSGERTSFDSPFLSSEGDQEEEVLAEPVRSSRNTYQQKETQFNNKKQRVATTPKKVVEKYVEEEPVIASKKQKVVSQPKKVVEEYIEEEEPVVTPKKQNPVKRAKPVVKEYIEEEEPVMVTTKQRVSKAKPVVKEYIEEEEEPVVVTKKQGVVSKAKPVVKEYIEEDEEPVVVTKKQRVVPKSKPVIKEYVEEEEEQVAPVKKQAVTKTKPVVKEYVEEEEEPVVINRKKQVSPKTKPVVKEYTEEEEVPVVITRKKQVSPKSKPVVNEYDEEKPVVTKKQTGKPTAKRVVEEYVEEEEPVPSTKKQKVTTKTQPVARNDEQWEEEQEQPIADPKKNYKTKVNSDTKGKSKSTNGRMDSESTSNVKKHKDTYYAESDLSEEMTEKTSKNYSNKSSKKSAGDQTEEYLDDNQWANSNAGQAKKSKYPTKTNVPKSVKEDQPETESNENLSDEGMVLNEVPLEAAADDNVIDAKKAGKPSRQKRSTAQTTGDTEEITPDVADVLAKTDKQSQRGGRASLFMGGIAKKGGKHYVVTNLAARGETVVVTNTANGKYITAEVIGPLPVRELSKGILLKVSENAKTDLEINSNFFNVIVNY